MSEFNGKFLNVTTRKGTEKVRITKELKTKGVIRDEAGVEYPIDQITKKGRGLYFDATKKAGTVKPAAQTENTRKTPSERPAPAAVTAAELAGKKINGVVIDRVLAKKGIVKMSDGETIQLADVRRKGQGYVVATEAPAEKTNTRKASGGATPKKAPAAPLKVKGREIEVDGDLQVITNTYTSGMVKTDADIKFALADIQEIDGELVYQSPEYLEAAKKAARSAARKQKENARPLEAAELKGKKIAYGDKNIVVEKTFSNTGRVQLAGGVKLDVSEIVREGKGYKFTGEVVVPRTGGAIPKDRKAPQQKPSIIAVPEFTGDIAADIREILKEHATTALAGYSISIAGIFCSVSPDVLTLSISLAATDADEIRVKQHLNALRKANKLAEADSAEEEEDDREFDNAELTGEGDDVPEDEGDDEEEEEDDEDEEEEDDEEEEEDEDENDEEDDADEFETESKTNDDADEFEVDDAETSFPEDTAELVEQATARLSKLMPGKNLVAYVEKWYASQDVYDALGYDLEPGQTVELDSTNYNILGLDKNGVPMLLNTNTGKLRPDVTLDLLASIAV